MYDPDFIKLLFIASIIIFMTCPHETSAIFTTSQASFLADITTLPFITSKHLKIYLFFFAKLITQSSFFYKTRL